MGTALPCPEFRKIGIPLLQQAVYGLFPTRYFLQFIEKEVVFLPADLDDACMKERTRQVDIADSTGMIATEYAYIYPPGIPAVVPGERISEGTVRNLERYHRNGFRIEGTKAEGKIEVLVNG